MEILSLCHFSKTNKNKPLIIWAHSMKIGRKGLTYLGYEGIKRQSAITAQKLHCNPATMTKFLSIWDWILFRFLDKGKNERRLNYWMETKPTPEQPLKKWDFEKFHYFLKASGGGYAGCSSFKKITNLQRWPTERLQNSDSSCFSEVYACQYNALKIVQVNQIRSQSR